MTLGLASDASYQDADGWWLIEVTPLDGHCENCGKRFHPIQFDPPGCGCTECLVGCYLPVDRYVGLKERVA